MPTIKTRVENLERSSGAGNGEPRRSYVVTGGSQDDDAWEFVRSQGYLVDEAHDMVVHIVGWAPNEDGPQPWGTKMGWCGPLPPERWRVAA